MSLYKSCGRVVNPTLLPVPESNTQCALSKPTKLLLSITKWIICFKDKQTSRYWSELAT